MSSVSNGRPEGERRKRKAFGLFEQYRRAFLRHARHVMIDHAVAHGTVSIDDVREAVQIPPHVDPRLFGGVPGELARQGILARGGYLPTDRAAGHARPVSAWKLIDHAAAARWKAENPVMPGPDPPAAPPDFVI